MRKKDREISRKEEATEGIQASGGFFLLKRVVTLVVVQAEIAFLVLIYRAVNLIIDVRNEMCMARRLGKED